MRTSFPKDRIKVLLLENISPTAHEVFAAEGFQVEMLKQAQTLEQEARR